MNTTALLKGLPPPTNTVNAEDSTLVEENGESVETTSVAVISSLPGSKPRNVDDSSIFTGSNTEDYMTTDRGNRVTRSTDSDVLSTKYSETTLPHEHLETTLSNNYSETTLTNNYSETTLTNNHSETILTTEHSENTLSTTLPETILSTEHSKITMHNKCPTTTLPIEGFDNNKGDSVDAASGEWSGQTSEHLDTNSLQPENSQFDIPKSSDLSTATIRNCESLTTDSTKTSHSEDNTNVNKPNIESPVTSHENMTEPGYPSGIRPPPGPRENPDRLEDSRPGPPIDSPPSSYDYEVYSLAGQSLMICKASKCEGICQDKEEMLDNNYIKEEHTLHTDVNFTTRDNDKNSEEKMDDDGCRTSETSLNKKYCWCDSKCVAFGDCCPTVFEDCFHVNESDILEFILQKDSEFDSMLFTGNLSNDRNQENYTEHNMVNLLDFYYVRYGKCVEINDNFYRVTSKCPNDYNSELVDMCERSTSFLPLVSLVQGSNHLAFRNIHCAKCHGVGQNELMAWESAVTCDVSAIRSVAEIKEYLKTGQCEVKFTPPPGLCWPRICFPAETKEPMTKSDLASFVEKGHCTELDAALCRSYILPLHDQRNPHCDKCLSLKRKKRDQDSVDRDQFFVCELSNMRLKPESDNTLGSPFGGVLLVLDITGQYTSNGEHGQVTVYFCEDDEVFEPTTQTCTRQYCPPGLEPYRGKCLPSNGRTIIPASTQLFPETWHHIKYTIIVQETTVDSALRCRSEITDNIMNFPLPKSAFENIVSVDRVDLLGLVPEMDRERMEEILGRCSSREERIVVEDKSDPSPSRDEFVTILDVYLSVPDNQNVFQALGEIVLEFDDFLNDERSIQSISFTNILESDSTVCPYNGKKRNISNLNFEFFKGKNYAVVNNTAGGILYPVQHIGFSVDIHAGNGKRIDLGNRKEIFVICESSLLQQNSCVIVSYWLNQTTVNGTFLVILETGETYGVGDFEVIGDRAYVCSDFEFEGRMSDELQSLAFKIVSICCSILSIIALLIMLLAYVMFSELRTLPGKMTANLAGSLMIMLFLNTLTYIDFHDDYICPVFAALHHLFALAAYAWMSAIAVNMALTFGSQMSNPINTLSSNTIFLRFASAVWVTSTAIVTTALVLDLTHPDDVEVKTEKTTEDNTAANSSSGLNESRYKSVDSQFPRYGYPNCFWFSGPLWVRMAFIIGPYGLSFIINVVGFTITLVGISRAKKCSERVSKKSSDRMTTIIYLKLSTVMGFSWALSALLPVFPTSQVLPYIYAITVLLQGVLIFLAFMVNKRVWNLFLGRFKSSKYLSSGSGFTSSELHSKTV